MARPLSGPNGIALTAIVTTPSTSKTGVMTVAMS